jgi:hypothetical protein
MPAEVTTNIDTSWVACGLFFNTFNILKCKPFAAQSVLYFSTMIRINSWEDGRVPITFYNAAGTAIARVICTGGNNNIATWQTSPDGAAWTTRFTHACSAMQGGLMKIDVLLELTATGQFCAFKNGVGLGAYTGDLSAVGTVAQFGIGPGYGDGTTFSEIMAADRNTLSWRYKWNVPTGNGADTAWANDYAAVDEVPYSTSDSITSATPGDTETFTAPARTFTGYTVKAVTVDWLAQTEIGAPQNIKGVVRKGGVDYLGTSKAVGAGITGGSQMFLTDPSTGVAWTPADAANAALEFGVQSAA